VTGGLAVDAAGLSRRYGSRWAVSDVSFQLAQGKTLLVAGRNGSGKSTLFRILATAIRPHAGSATVAGYSLNDRENVRRKIALLSHSPYTYESLTARENLDVAARFLGKSRPEIDSLLELVGLGHRAEDRVDTFSAGMRKRLMLARTLLQDAPVVLLDEPYGQLDPAGFTMIDRLIVRLRAEGKTLLVATHLVERVALLADLAFVLESGSIAWSGAAKDVTTAAAQHALREEGIS